MRWAQTRRLRSSPARNIPHLSMANSQILTKRIALPIPALPRRAVRDVF
jgi:hypothetical protein